jgi:hypothetical protein
MLIVVLTLLVWVYLLHLIHHILVTLRFVFLHFQYPHHLIHLTLCLFSVVLLEELLHQFEHQYNLLIYEFFC